MSEFRVRLDTGWNDEPNEASISLCIEGIEGDVSLTDEQARRLASMLNDAAYTMEEFRRRRGSRKDDRE